MDTIIAKEKLKKEIEDHNNHANMVEDMYYAFESYISELERGNKEAKLRIPPICRSTMNILGITDEYRLLDVLTLGLTEFSFSSITSGDMFKMRDVIVRSYTGSDVSFDEWHQEIHKLVAKIIGWRKDLETRVFNAKYN